MISQVSARLLGLGPWPSTFLGPPKKGVWDVTADERHGIVRVVPVEAAPPNLPAILPHCDASLEEKMRATLIDLKELQTIELLGGRYVSGSLAVIDRSDRLLYDYTQVWQPQFRHANAVFDFVRLPKAISLPGLTLLLDVPAHNRNYCHWLIEAGNRIAAAEYAGYSPADFDTVLVSGPLLSFHRVFLEAFGFDAARVIDPVAAGGHVRCERLVTATNSREHLFDITRTRLRQVFPVGSAGSGNNRILISRRQASQRRICNEDALFDALAPLNFRSVALDGMTTPEEAELFGHAEMIVAPHGAGLANCIFCPPGTAVIEIHFPGYAKGIFWRMADRCQLSYYAIAGERPSDPESQDMNCDPEKVLAAVEYALQARLAA